MDNRKNDKILIVDDNPANLSVLSACLEKENFEVLIAQNGESAIQKANYVLPDLIVLDVMMPGIDGFETCKRLKENPKTQKIPIILMTALSDIDNKVKGLKSGAVDYITKPFQQEEVLARINIHLKVHHLTQEIQEKNSKLEAEVTERILSEEKLKKTLEQLKKTQVKLVQSEKISGLGRVVAGICHEFNNPIGFITGNIQFLREYTEQLLDFFDLNKNDYLTLESAKILDKSIEFDENEFKYIVNDIPKVISSIEAGTGRITDIIERLKKFSYLDQAGKKQFDIHEGLDRTIALLNHRFQPVLLNAAGTVIHRPKIKVIKEYDTLPILDCYPHQMNQVFLNLITNSIDAIDAIYERSGHSNIEPVCSSHNVEVPLLNFRTKCYPTHISIHVIDSGLGIPEDIQAQIFDPFFTTKAVGKGVGLGLAICFQIVTEMHGGCLNCTSNESGTEMVIELPLDKDGLSTSTVAKALASDGEE